ncbi:MAG TPA: GNAT family N-acetyltransferase [Gaiellaceae bacterium]|nr:GNAT family N-acetyltransferase [Gaiellaceae bacterium]
MLRAVEQRDLDALFEQQADPVGSAMAGVPSRDRKAFDEHWRRITANDQNVIRVIDLDGEAVGHVLSWPAEGRRYVGYWIAREYWGRGLATAGLNELLGELRERPLHALVSTTNVGSIRVLEKCGFVAVGPADDEMADEGVPGLLYELRDAPSPGD